MAEAHFLESIAISDELATPLPAARTKRDLATVLTSRGDSSAAAALIDQALTVFAAHDARELHELREAAG
ncbi:hypothetical protein ACIBG7_29365 [Nonomuraea sp. NPDC050328]|uniref:hypothetical protein n=1 Tax=Nonomuraea sp. NPDC050328 TaxID=3364361 RepID=UPI003795A200